MITGLQTVLFRLGTKMIDLQKECLALWHYLTQIYFEILRPPFRIKEVLTHINFFSLESLPVVLICVSFAAMVTLLESSFHMKLVIGDDGLVPGFAALLILRELGAMITGLLLTARVGASITAEIANQKISDQIEALHMIGVRPINYLVVPRFFAGVISGGLTTLLANLICLIAAQQIANYYMGFSFETFITALSRFSGFEDYALSGLKGAVFGGIIPLVSCYLGFKCQGGAEQVGLVTTQSVVSSSVLIIIADFILTVLFTL